VKEEKKKKKKKKKKKNNNNKKRSKNNKSPKHCLGDLINRCDVWAWYAQIKS
jgi:hypothetical protein